MLPGFKSFFYKEYESKVMSIEFIEKTRKVLFGFHDGQLNYFDYAEKNLDKPQPNSIILSNECILFIKHLYGTLCLIVLPTAIKIIQSIWIFLKNL